MMRQCAGELVEKGRARAARLLHLTVRVLTLPPIVVGVTLVLLYAPAKTMTLRELLLSELFLLVIPTLAYPLREIFKIGPDRRTGQRTAAMACSAAGYVCGFVWTLLTPCSQTVRVLFSSYVISIAALLLFNKVLGFMASGHACSTTAPTILLTWKLHPLALVPSLALIYAVYRSSLRLGRHTLPQLLTGSAISVAATALSVLLCGA